MVGTILAAALLLGFALLAYWTDLQNARTHRHQRALERARARRPGP